MNPETARLHASLFPDLPLPGAPKPAPGPKVGTALALLLADLTDRSLTDADIRQRAKDKRYAGACPHLMKRYFQFERGN